MSGVSRGRLPEGLSLLLQRLAPPRERLRRLARRTFAGHRTIVVPLLDETSSEHALDLACRLAADRLGRVLVVAPLVVEPELPLDALFEEEERALKQRLRRAEAVANTYGIASSGRLLRTRNAAAEVVAEAEEIGATLIVVGAPILSRRGFNRAFPGTVERILRDAPCRVMVATGPFAGRSEGVKHA